MAEDNEDNDSQYDEFHEREKERDQKMEQSQSLKEMRESLDTLKLFSESYVEAIRVQATILKSAFDALVSAGFTDTQAIEIIKVRGSNL